MRVKDLIAKLEKLEPLMEIYCGRKWMEPFVEIRGDRDFEQPFRYYIVFNMEQYPTDS